MRMRVGREAFIMGPPTQGAPDDLDALVVDFIDKSKQHLKITARELEFEPTALATMAMCQCQMLTKLISEQMYLKSITPKTYPSTSGGNGESSRADHNAILRCNSNVEVHYITNIFHQKYIVCDRNAMLIRSHKSLPNQGMQKSQPHSNRRGTGCC